MRLPHNDALVVTVHTGCCKVSKILVYGRSSVNILYEHALDWMDDAPELARKLIIPQTQSLLYGFDGNEARSPDIVRFLILVDSYNVVTEFSILNVPSPYNAILGRPWIHMMRAVPSTHHQLLKYLTPFWTANIRGDQAMARTVIVVARKKSRWT